MKLIIVSGLSGAGKSIALDTLEDLGFYCVDNLPIPLLPVLAKELKKTQSKSRYIAVGIDARSDPKSLPKLPEILDQLKKLGFDCDILFLEADEAVLIQRFSETRRKHPLTDATGSLPRAIELERDMLAPLMEKADLRIDTRNTHVHQLRRLLRERFSNRISGSLSIQFLSFGFKFGVPNDADFVLDVRCLPNPHWQPELRDQTGKDRPVISFLEAAPVVMEMKQDIISFLEKWISTFDSEGRSYLTIAFGCTGGRHRSVYMAESLAAHFDNGKYSVNVRHRENP